MTTAHWLRPHSFKTPDQTADVVVIGGGYAGLSSAYWLSEYRPDLKIIVLDRGNLGSGASGRNAGFLTRGSATFYKGLVRYWGKERAKELFDFGDDSINLIHQHILKVSPEVKFEKTSSLTLFQTESGHQDWESTEFNPGDFRFEWRSSEELAPTIRHKFVGAYENGPEFKLNPLQLLMSLKTKLEARKIQLVENASAFELTPEGVATELHLIKCRQVVLALNGYFPEFHSAFKDLIIPNRAQMLAVELEDEIDSSSLHYDSPERIYWRRAQDKILLIGGKRLLDETGEIGNFEKLSPLIQAGLEDYLRDCLKVRFKVIHRWSGIMGFTSHELPIITRAKAPLDAYVIGGFSGHGMGFGFRAAQELAELAVGKKEKSYFDHLKPVQVRL